MTTPLQLMTVAKRTAPVSVRKTHTGNLERVGYGRARDLTELGACS
jgi:hypothetical protein